MYFKNFTFSIAILFLLTKTFLEPVHFSPSCADQSIFLHSINLVEVTISNSLASIFCPNQRISSPFFANSTPFSNSYIAPRAVLNDPEPFCPNFKTLNNGPSFDNAPSVFLNISIASSSLLKSPIDGSYLEILNVSRSSSAPFATFVAIPPVAPPPVFCILLINELSSSAHRMGIPSAVIATSAD